MGIIYKLTSPSGKSYVGLTTQQIEKRMWKHKRGRRCRLLSRAIEKYGFDTFKLEVLDENVPNRELGELERTRIEEHGTLAPNGYNLSTGGETGFHFTNCTRKVQSAATSKSWTDPTVRAKRVSGLKEYHQKLDIEGRKRQLKVVSSMHTQEVKERANAGKRLTFTRNRIEKYLTLSATSMEQANRFLDAAIALDKKRNVRGWWGEGFIP